MPKNSHKYLYVNTLIKKNQYRQWFGEHSHLGENLLENIFQQWLVYFFGLHILAEKNSRFIWAINSTDIPFGQSYSHA